MKDVRCKTRASTKFRNKSTRLKAIIHDYNVDFDYSTKYRATNNNSSAEKLKI